MIFHIFITALPLPQPRKIYSKEPLANNCPTSFLHCNFKLYSTLFFCIIWDGIHLWLMLQHILRISVSFHWTISMHPLKHLSETEAVNACIECYSIGDWLHILTNSFMFSVHRQHALYRLQGRGLPTIWIFLDTNSKHPLVWHSRSLPWMAVSFLCKCYSLFLGWGFASVPMPTVWNKAADFFHKLRREWYCC